jgi:KUP system potassium uptake protein
MIRMERYRSADLQTSGRVIRKGIEGSRGAKIMLKMVGVLGVSMVMSDGVLTPAQSVLGAIQGLEVVAPNISSATIVGVSCAILVLLFLVQPLGTSKLAITFAPIVIIWLSFNAAFGIYNLVFFDHTVLKAFSPFYAGDYLVRNQTDGWKSLGGILLAFTGVEALFADLGAFSRRAIQLSWMCFAFPCLLLAYIGQAAYISVTPAAYENPFFNTVPPGMFYPSLVIAILAAVVASQAMITASFQVGGLRRRRTVLTRTAALPSHAVLVLPAHQGDPHLHPPPRSDLHPFCELVAHDRHRHRDRGVQQRGPPRFPLTCARSADIFPDNEPGKCVGARMPSAARG